MKLIGTITKKTDIEIVGQKWTQKQTILLTQWEWKQEDSFVIDFIADGINQLVHVNVWDAVEVSAKFKATERNGKTFWNCQWFSCKKELKPWQVETAQWVADLPF